MLLLERKTKGCQDEAEDVAASYPSLLAVTARHGLINPMDRLIFNGAFSRLAWLHLWSLRPNKLKICTFFFHFNFLWLTLRLEQAKDREFLVFNIILQCQETVESFFFQLRISNRGRTFINDTFFLLIIFEALDFLKVCPIYKLLKIDECLIIWNCFDVFVSNCN